MKRIVPFMLAGALFSLPAIASGKTSSREEKRLLDLEAHCWAGTVEDGGFLCQYLMLMGRTEGADGWQVPELHAPDNEEKRRSQASLACEKLGFRYARRFETATAEKETLMVRLEPSAQFVWLGKGTFIRHVICD